MDTHQLATDTGLSVKPHSVIEKDGVVIVDVRELNCPSYLLAVNRIVGHLDAGSQIRLLITYPRCENEVKAWCHMKGFDYLGEDETADNISVSFKIN